MGEEDHVKDDQDRGDRKPDDSFELPDHVVDQAELGHASAPWGPLTRWP